MRHASLRTKIKKGGKDKDASAKCDDGSNSDADANDHDADAATDVSHMRHLVKAMGRPAIHTRCKVMARPVVKDKLGTQTG